MDSATPLRDRWGGTGAFTLLEVMISLAIVGALLVTLLYSLNYHMGIALRHETLTVAHMLGREKLAETKATPKNAEGVFDEPYSDYTYITVVKPAAYPGISEINVTVAHGREKVVVRELIK
jgi:prepilin-type N-terminal cleavage/methylation domain-containing protein